MSTFHEMTRRGRGILRERRSRVLRRRRRLLGGALDRSGARHCSAAWGGDRARSEVVRIAETRSKQTADTNVSQCSRSIAGAHRCGAVCWCTVLHAQQARRSTLAPAATRWQQCWLRGQLYYEDSASLCDRWTARDLVLVFCLASVLRAARSTRRESLAPGRARGLEQWHSSLQSSSRR